MKRAMLVFLCLVIGITTCSLASATTTVEEKTWGTIKALYRTPGEVNQEPEGKIGAWMSVAWPFGSSENPDNWYGDEGNRTSGAWIYLSCRRMCTWTHSGAEYYARDLNRDDGTDYGKKVYAGFSGRVIKAGDDGGYGKTVVIYDSSRHVAIRYAHLSYISVRKGDWVNIRQYIGKVGNTGNSTGSHLHIVGYENINDNNGNPIIPTLCDSNFFACAIYFHS